MRVTTSIVTMIGVMASSIALAGSFDLFSFDTGSGSPDIDPIIPEDGFGLQVRADGDIQVAFTTTTGARAWTVDRGNPANSDVHTLGREVVYPSMDTREYASSTVGGMNASLDIAGSVYDTYFVREAVVWEWDGAGYDVISLRPELPVTENPDGPRFSIAYDINDAGTVVGAYRERGAAGIPWQGVIWPAGGGSQNVPFPPEFDAGTCPGRWNAAEAINNAGGVVGLAGCSSSDPGTAFYWDGSAANAQLITGFPGGTITSAAHAISDDRIVGSYVAVGNLNQAEPPFRSFEIAISDVGMVGATLNVQLPGGTAGLLADTMTYPDGDEAVFGFSRIGPSTSNLQAMSSRGTQLCDINRENSDFLAWGNNAYALQAINAAALDDAGEPIYGGWGVIGGVYYPFLAVPVPERADLYVTLRQPSANARISNYHVLDARGTGANSGTQPRYAFANERGCSDDPGAFDGVTSDLNTSAGSTTTGNAANGSGRSITQRNGALTNSFVQLFFPDGLYSNVFEVTAPSAACTGNDVSSIEADDCALSLNPCGDDQLQSGRTWIDLNGPNRDGSDADGCEFPSDRAIYVNCSSGNDANDGSRSAPLRSVRTGISRAAGNNYGAVFVAAGTCNETTTVDVTNGVNLYGAFTPGTWVRNPDSLTTVLNAGSASVAVRFNNIAQATRFDGFTVNGRNFSGTGSQSTYGVWISNSSSNVRVANVTVNAGNAANGANGTPGTAGSNGGNGNNGSGGTGGARGTNSNCGNANGGNGGSSSRCDDTGGSAGSSGQGPSAGGGGSRGTQDCAGYSFPIWYCSGNDGGSAFNGNSGGSGGSGGPGSIGTSATAPLGSANTGGFVLASGGSGATGGNGSGGGGGGGGGADRDPICTGSGARGGGGGGGGAGGCGGSGGTGGQGGGGSFGFFVINSTPSFENVSVNRGNGGRGGAGATGGNGGAGGSGGNGAGGEDRAASGEGGDGGRGGDGGNGGRGGDGGDGCGGPALGIAVVGSGPSSLPAGLTVSGGSGGPPPAGGSCSGATAAFHRY